MSESSDAPPVAFSDGQQYAQLGMIEFNFADKCSRGWIFSDSAGARIAEQPGEIVSSGQLELQAGSATSPQFAMSATELETHGEQQQQQQQEQQFAQEPPADAEMAALLFAAQQHQQLFSQQQSYAQENSSSTQAQSGGSEQPHDDREISGQYDSGAQADPNAQYQQMQDTTVDSMQVDSSSKEPMRPMVPTGGAAHGSSGPMRGPERSRREDPYPTRGPRGGPQRDFLEILRDTKTLYLAGVPPDTADEELMNYFRDFNPKGCRVPRYDDSGKTKGFASNRVGFAMTRDIVLT